MVILIFSFKIFVINFSLTFFAQKILTKSFAKSLENKGFGKIICQFFHKLFFHKGFDNYQLTKNHCVHPLLNNYQETIEKMLYGDNRQNKRFYHQITSSNHFIIRLFFLFSIFYSHIDDIRFTKGSYNFFKSIHYYILISCKFHFTNILTFN